MVTTIPANLSSICGSRMVEGKNWLPRVALIFTPMLWNVREMNVTETNQKVKSSSSGLGTWLSW